MATPTTTISSNSRALRFFAIGVLVALAALIAAADSYASNKVDGISADLKQGTLRVKGSDGGQQVALRLKAGDPSKIQVDAGNDGSADFTFASSDVNAIKVKLGDGNDLARIDDANGSFTGDSRPTTIAGGDGNDTLLGAQNPPAGPAANQVETYKGGAGNDTVDGGRGNDTAYLGAGNDTFRWDNGEGSDVIEGQDGSDTMLFNGNTVNTDTVTMSANQGRLKFFRDQGMVTMDTNDVEIVDFNALGGADSITVNDLTGTDVTQTNVDLALTLGGNAPDGVVDTVTNATNGDDTIVSVAHADATDQLNGPIQLLVD
jgi:Ca2+-binding RTX toxin-like protein